ncbi:MAG TPA: hypothetical protein VF002_01865 [Gaiellaceae bacterium]
MTRRRYRLATASAWLGAALLSLGVAAAPARGIHRATHVSARLLVSPGNVPPASGIAPGDTIQRPIELMLLGRGRLASVYLEVSTPAKTAIDANPQQGLQIRIDRCSKRWRQQGASYACSGKHWLVLSTRPLLGRSRLKRLGLRRGKRSHLRLLLTFPASAGNALQGQCASIVYSFVGIAGR